MPPEGAGLYHVEAVVWTGETAEICRARGPNGERVAIKRIRSDRQSRANMRSLAHEARMALGLTHPNIIEVFHFVTDPPYPMMIMEFFPSRNLKVRVLSRRGDALVTYHTPELLAQMAAALRHVHDNGIIHMDLKPENFLLSDDGRVKLTDFALARRQASRLRRLLAGPRKIAGTRPYIAPETLRKRTPDFRTDIYSFGATVYEMLTRRPPFISSDRDELLSMHLRDPPPWPWTYNKNLTREINDLVLAMLAKDPGRRPQSMADIVTRLRRIRIYERPPVEPSDEGNQP